MTTFLEFRKKQSSDDAFGQYVPLTLQQLNNKIKNRVKMDIEEKYENDEMKINNYTQ